MRAHESVEPGNGMCDIDLSLLITPSPRQAPQPASCKLVEGITQMSITKFERNRPNPRQKLWRRSPLARGSRAGRRAASRRTSGARRPWPGSGAPTGGCARRCGAGSGMRGRFRKAAGANTCRSGRPASDGRRRRPRVPGAIRNTRSRKAALPNGPTHARGACSEQAVRGTSGSGDRIDSVTHIDFTGVFVVSRAGIEPATY